MRNRLDVRACYFSPGSLKQHLMKSFTCFRHCHELFACICHWVPSSALLNGWAHYLHLTDEDRGVKYLIPGPSICGWSTETMRGSRENADVWCDVTAMIYVFVSHGLWGGLCARRGYRRHICFWVSQEVPVSRTSNISPLLQSWEECPSWANEWMGLSYWALISFPAMSQRQCVWFPPIGLVE